MRTGRNLLLVAVLIGVSLDHWDMRTGRNEAQAPHLRKLSLVWCLKNR